MGTGPLVTQFEEEFRDYKGVHHAVAVNSCSAALHLSLIALDIEPGDEVITTPLTFASTVNSIIHAGATPVLADVDPVTMNLNPDAVANVINPRTRAIIPVHFAGRSCDMDVLQTIAEENRLDIVEDCAHAVETVYKGRPAGSMGRFGCFSFYVTKNMTTVEGGMVVTRSYKDAARIKTLALHGMNHDAWHRYQDDGYKHYSVVEAGFKYNMTDIQAAIGIHQLRRIASYRQRRKIIWQTYMEQLADLPVTLPAPFESDSRHALHLFTLLIDPARLTMTRDQ